MFSIALVVTSACRLITLPDINPKQASQAADIAHDCVEAKGLVWPTGGNRRSRLPRLIRCGWRYMARRMQSQQRLASGYRGATIFFAKNIIDIKQ
jgi:hypothetical protein